MRLTQRLALLLAAVTAGVLLLLEAIVLRRERELLVTDYSTRVVLIADAVAMGVLLDPDDLVPTGSPPARAEVDAQLDRIGVQDAELQVRWRRREELQTLADLDRLRAGQSTPARWVPRPEGPAITAWAPVFVEGELLGAVEVSRPLSSVDAFVDRSLRAALWGILIITGLTGAAATVLGRLLVGRSVERLVEKTRQVARGDLSQPVAVSGGDELALLARALEQMSADLERLQRLAAQEAQARLEAERALLHADRLRTLGVLSAGLAHELGTPLNVISGRAQLLARRSADPAVHADAAAVREQVDRISRLVRRIMAFARGSSPERRPCDLADLAEHAAEMLAPEARQKGVALDVELPPGGLRVTVDPDQLTQVLTNLVLNAVHSSPEGGHVRVQVAALPDGATRLRVEDQGPGVPPELRERIFEPFFTTKAPGEGTGLGLSIVRRIVEDHGGQVHVEQAAGGGAAFTLTLPAPEPT